MTLDMLEETRMHMPPERFDRLWGTHYQRLWTEERAKAITKITQRELGQRARRCLDQVQQFLQGSGRVTSEILCEWILFCHSMELYTEAAALFRYIRKGEIDRATFEWVKGIAETSRQKLAG